jgi:hypothetical protein
MQHNEINFDELAYVNLCADCSVRTIKGLNAQTAGALLVKRVEDHLAEGKELCFKHSIDPSTLPWEEEAKVLDCLDSRQAGECVVNGIRRAPKRVSSRVK